MRLPRRVASFLLPPRRPTPTVVDGSWDRFGVRDCTPAAYLPHPLILLRPRCRL